jgi:hypothetical protein
MTTKFVAGFPGALDGLCAWRFVEHCSKQIDDIKNNQKRKKPGQQEDGTTTNII